MTPKNNKKLKPKIKVVNKIKPQLEKADFYNSDTSLAHSNRISCEFEKEELKMRQKTKELRKIIYMSNH